jgi:uncharacterized protein YhaN
MGDIFEEVKDDRTVLEKITDFIPGWNGYQERQTRRKADQLLRETLADKLADQRRKLNEAQKDLIANKRIDLVDDLESASTQLQTFIDRIRVATYGYAGIFDAKKVKEVELERLYNFDAALVDYVERLNAANDRLRQSIPSGEGLVETIRIVRDICNEANSTFDEREHVILGSA